MPTNSETSPRGEVTTHEPTRPGNGTSRRWVRVIRGVRYSFTLVNMPSGEVRWVVSRWTLDGAPGTPGYPNMGCYWVRHREWTFQPSDTPIRENSETSSHDVCQYFLLCDREPVYMVYVRPIGTIDVCVRCLCKADRLSGGTARREIIGHRGDYPDVSMADVADLRTLFPAGVAE